MAWPTTTAAASMITTVMRCSGVKLSRASCGSVSHTATRVTSSMTPKPAAANITPIGRKRSGRDGRSRPDGSEPAGMDVGGEDPPGTDLVELVHDLLRAVARHHRADRHPPLAVQGRDGRALDPGRQRDGLLDADLGDVVVHHHVRAGDEHAL